MFDITILLLFLAIVLLLLDLSTSLKKIANIKEMESRYYFTKEFEEAELVSDYEREKKEREIELDERVKRLQREVESNIYNNQNIYDNTTAEILEDGIYNIPHNDVYPSLNQDITEVAE